LAVGALLFAWSGIYNIAATDPHWNLTLAFIGMLRDRSIEARSEDIRTPNLEDPEFENAAFSHYHGMCRLCHGAPGYEAEEFAKGLYPAPPSMISGHIQPARSETETYWIVKHGIKMTGMPAFGPTHDDEELWGLTALVNKIPRTTAEEYRRQVETAGLNGEKDQGHVHGHSENDKDHGHGQDEGSEHDEAEEDHH
jgi:hypothetical protein